MSEDKGDSLRCLAPGNEGSFWTIPYFNLSGLYSAVYSDAEHTTVVHYVRQATNETWTVLMQFFHSNTDQHRILRVYGDPGSGKSTTVWAYTMHMSAKVNVAWVAQDTDEYVINLSGPNKEPTKLAGYEFDDYCQLVQKIVEHNPKLVVLDGIRAKMKTVTLGFLLTELIKNLTDNAGFVICTSLQSVDYISANLFEIPHDSFLLTGWSAEDMIAARNEARKSMTPIFPLHLLTNDADFRRQLYLAGGNIRFMQGDPRSVEDELRMLLKRVPLNALWVTAADARSDICNCLFVHYNKDKIRFVSEFVSREVSQRTTFTVLKEALLSYDPGWLFQLCGRKIFEKAVSAGSYVTFDKVEKIRKAKRFHIRRLVEFTDAQCDGPAHLTHETHCYIPVRRNEGCFDFVLIQRAPTEACDVYFLQFTVANAHDVLLKYAATFLRQMFPANVDPMVTRAQENQAPVESEKSGGIPIAESTVFQKLFGIKSSPPQPGDAAPAVQASQARAAAPRSPPLTPAPAPASGVSGTKASAPGSATVAAAAQAGVMMAGDGGEASQTPVGGAGGAHAGESSRQIVGSGGEDNTVVDTAAAAESASGAKGPVEVLATPNSTSAATNFPKAKVKVHFYFVLPEDRARAFRLHSCTAFDVESIQNFDPNFTTDNIRVTYIRGAENMEDSRD